MVDIKTDMYFKIVCLLIDQKISRHLYTQLKATSCLLFKSLSPTSKAFLISHFQYSLFLILL